MHRHIAALMAAVTVVLAAVQAALINQLNGDWWWWVLAAVVTLGLAAVTAWVAARSTSRDAGPAGGTPGDTPILGPGAVNVAGRVGGSISTNVAITGQADAPPPSEPAPPDA